jgi:hypothetical protein
MTVLKSAGSLVESQVHLFTRTCHPVDIHLHKKVAEVTNVVTKAVLWSDGPLVKH